ncbi:regulator [Halobacteriales archaeon QS_8_69_26]|nr:MAG: regulator [Halobacteriales archaeon QS_8_69_26]
MSVETDSDADVELDELTSLGRELGEAIRDLEEYRVFEEKSEAVEADDEAQEKIQAFEQQRQEFMLARQTGEASQEDMTELQRAQQELHEIPVMAEFLRAREELVERLEEVNRAISDPLEVDFGKEAGGCCQDE